MARLPAPRAPIKTGQQRAKDAIDYSHSLQQEQARRDELTALQKDHDAAVARGVLPSALPELHEDMSRQDIKNAATKIGFLSGGKSDADPFGSQATGNAAQTARGGAFRGSTPDEIKDFFDSDPINGTAAKEEAARVRTQAGTGEKVQTPYGTMSLSDPKYGPGATWMDQVVNRYPEIGKPGTDANKAFTAAYNSAIRQTGPNADGTPAGKVDPHALADQVMNQLAKTGPNSDLETPDMPVGTPAKPPDPKPGAGFAAGQAVRNIPAATGSMLENAGGAINRTIDNADDALDNFVAGVSGKTPDQIQQQKIAEATTPPEPGQSVPAPTPDELATAKSAARANAATAYAKAGVPAPVRTGSGTKNEDEDYDHYGDPSQPGAPTKAMMTEGVVERPTPVPTAPAQPAVTPDTTRPDDPKFSDTEPTAPIWNSAVAPLDVDATTQKVPDDDQQKQQPAPKTSDAKPASAPPAPDTTTTPAQPGAAPVTGDLQVAKGTQAVNNANPDDDFAALGSHMINPSVAPHMTTDTGAVTGDLQSAKGAQSSRNANPDDDFAAFAKPASASAAPAASPVGDTANSGGVNNTAGNETLSTFAKNPEDDEFQNRLNNQEAA